jgi:hypothetical protein
MHECMPMSRSMYQLLPLSCRFRVSCFGDSSRESSVTDSQFYNPNLDGLLNRSKWFLMVDKTRLVHPYYQGELAVGCR